MSGQVGQKNCASDSYSLFGEPDTDGTRRGFAIFNLGTGKGSSVLQVISAFGQACGKDLKYEICERRPGDIATCYAACDKAKNELEWVAQFDIKRMCQDS